jgi:hypothetical protein
LKSKNGDFIEINDRQMTEITSLKNKIAQENGEFWKK